MITHQNLLYRGVTCTMVDIGKNKFRFVYNSDPYVYNLKAHIQCDSITMLITSAIDEFHEDINNFSPIVTDDQHASALIAENELSDTDLIYLFEQAAFMMKCNMDIVQCFDCLRTSARTDVKRIAELVYNGLIAGKTTAEAMRNTRAFLPDVLFTVDAVYNGGTETLASAFERLASYVKNGIL